MLDHGCAVTVGSSIHLPFHPIGHQFPQTLDVVMHSMNGPRLAPGSIVWQPSPQAAAQTQLAQFMQLVRTRYGMTIDSYEDLHAFSVTRLEDFWRTVWDFARIIGDPGPAPYLRLREGTIEGATWFPSARLNIAENMLRGATEALAVIALDEAGSEQTFSRQQLRDAVSRTMQAMRASGIGPGDRVVAYLPNALEILVAAIACLALGAVWSSCAPNLAPQAVLDRWRQISPKLLLVTDEVLYGGKTRDCLAASMEIARGLPSIERVIGIAHGKPNPFPETVRLWDDWTGDFVAQPLRFERFAFEHPAFVLFSSGTTGAPKCITHGCGGALLVHAVDRLLHLDVHAGDRIFEATNPGWMMWNYLITALAWDSTVILYDGSPVHPAVRVLADIADRYRIAFFGIPTSLVHEWMKSDLDLRTSHDLRSVRAMTVGGSTLDWNAWEYLYRHVNSDMHFSSPSGGTDILAFFVGGNPIGPCRVGETQVAGLGRALDVLDEKGRPIRGQPGELVCTRPLPSMPVCFWGDEGGQRYHQAYFDRFPGIWHHGDWVEVTINGGFRILGRSDSTLNINGVRFGPQELYKQLFRFAQIVDAVAVEQLSANGSRLLLFLQLGEGAVLDGALEHEIRSAIIENASAQFVPALIVAAPDLPRVLSGKVSEVAVKHAVNGRRVTNTDSLANPESLRYFQAFAAQGEKLALPDHGGATPDHF